jgi:protoheme IX farnesyltransferase
MMPASGWRAADYWTLTKPEVNLLIGVTTAAGFCLAGDARGGSTSGLVHTVAGTLLVASGTGTLNQLVERRFDALMRRTASRPVAAGRIAPSRALAFGLGLATAGIVELATFVNILSSALALATMASYLLAYTPLKRKTSLCTVVGALPGAAPPLIGWAGATGSLTLEAWILYAIVFLWQFPHFMAIAWMYREDYRRAGYRLVPRDDSRERFILYQMMIPLLALLPLSVAPVVLGRAGGLYLVTALALGAGFTYRANRLVAHRTNAMARQLLLASIVYLPLIFAALVFDGI